MTQAVVKQQINTLKVSRRNKAKRSKPYWCALLLIAYTAFYYFYELNSQNDGGDTNFIIILFTAFCDLVLFMVIINKAARVPIKAVVLTSCFLIANITSFLIVGSGFHRILVLLMFLFAIILFSTQPMSKKEAKKAFWIFAVVVGALLLNTSVIGKEVGKFNSNGGGFLSTVLYCAALALFLTYGKHRKYKKWKYLLICLAAVILQFRFGSRTALAGLLLFTIAALIFRAARKTFKPRSVACVILLLACLGVLVAYIYAEILPTFIDKNFIIFGKKLFSGREVIWHYTFESVQTHWLFGVGGRLNEQYIADNAIFAVVHNQPLGVLAEGGVFVFVFFYLAMAACVAVAYKRNGKYFFNRIPAVFIAVIMCMSYFDNYFTSLYNMLPIIIVFSIIMGTCRRACKID